MTDSNGKSTSIDDAMEAGEKMVKEVVKSITGKHLYFLTTHGVEFIATVTSIMPDGFVLYYPARLYEIEGDPRVYLETLGRFSFNRFTYMSFEKLLTYGEAQPSIQDFYVTWRTDMLEREKEYIAKYNASKEEESKSTEAEKEMVSDLEKSGKIINLHPSPRTKQ